MGRRKDEASAPASVPGHTVMGKLDSCPATPPPAYLYGRVGAYFLVIDSANGTIVDRHPATDEGELCAKRLAENLNRTRRP